MYRSAGWPLHDPVEVDLLAAGLLERVRDAQGRETLRLTDAGLAALVRSQHGNRRAFDAHESLVLTVARQLRQGGRVVFTGLSLRARLAPVPVPVPVHVVEPPALPAPAAQADGPPPPSPGARWVVARPDVFSVRNTSKPGYLFPAVHEIKVKRADVLGELRRPDKCAAYLDMSSEAWFVLGRDARGREIADASELPESFGVLQLAADGQRLQMVRPAPRRARELGFGIWLALAKAVPLEPGEDAQARW